MPPAPDIAVVGAGIVGLCAAYALLELGATVTVYERGFPGNGQSGGESRIFRHAHDDPRLVELALESRASWDDWGRRLGVELVSGDGVVAIGSSVEHRLQVLERVGGVPARSIDGAELSDRLPLLAGYDGPAMPARSVLEAALTATTSRGNPDWQTRVSAARALLGHDDDVGRGGGEERVQPEQHGVTQATQ